MRFEPVAQPLGIVTLANPLGDCKTAGIFLCEREERLQPALMFLGKVQIRKAGELTERFFARSPAAAMDEKERSRKTCSILATGTFDEKGTWRAVECVE